MSVPVHQLSIFSSDTDQEVASSAKESKIELLPYLENRRWAHAENCPQSSWRLVSGIEQAQQEVILRASGKKVNNEPLLVGVLEAVSPFTEDN